jgi:hypothetical protein
MTKDKLSIDERTELEYLREKLGKIGSDRPKKDRLISTREIIKRVDMRADSRTWRAIRLKLIADYGLTKIEGGGLRMLESRFEKFLTDHYV